MYTLYMLHVCGKYLYIYCGGDVACKFIYVYVKSKICTYSKCSFRINLSYSVTHWNYLYIKNLFFKIYPKDHSINALCSRRNV